MPRPGASPRQYRCKLCAADGVETILDTFGEVGRHRASAHPTDYQRPATVSREPARPGPRRIEDVSGSADRPGGVPPASGDASPRVAHPEPSADPETSPTGGRLRPTRPQVSQPVIRISPEMRTEGVRDAIRDALPMSTLADLLHAVSVAVSEADGAGEAGYLSPIQCTQVAFLLYDSTIDLVVSRFDGNVGRFKAAMAVTLILVSKGTIHARAIGSKVQARRVASGTRVPLPAPEAPAGTDNGEVPSLAGLPVAPAPELTDTYAAAAERQAALMNAGMVQ